MESLLKQINKISFNTTHLKLIACITMLIDHLGIVFFSHYIIFRIIGRIAFPLFAYQIVISREKTSSRKRFYYRLILLALVSQIPYMLLLAHRLNIMFTFLFSLACIEMYEKNKTAGIAISLLAIYFAYGNYMISYSAYGLIMVFVFYLLKDKIKLLFGQALLNTSYGLIVRSVQPYALLCMLFIGFYNGTLGNKKINKMLFWFYPAHLLILYIIKQILQ